MTAFPSLREFITALERAGELVRVREPFSSDLEIAALADRVMKTAGGGKALLFENVDGGTIPVLINAFGSRRRLELALGVRDLEELPGRVAALLSTSPPNSLGEAIRLLPKLLDLKGVLPRKERGQAPCQEIVKRGAAVDLGQFPVLKCWPDDGGRFITFPCVFTRSSQGGPQNIGMYRLQVYDHNTTGMHWHIHKDGSTAHRGHVRRDRPTEAAVAIGTDPVVTYCATAPLPYGVSEVMLAGFIRKKAVKMVPCVSVDLEVPATAEIVLEGYVEPAETRVEGPFGDHTGVYSPAEPYPVFHVTAITHRRNPIYSTTVVGIPPMEDEWLGLATERIFRPLLNTQWPEVTEMHLPPAGVFHNFCFLGVDKHYPMQARRLFQGLWGTGQMSFTKILAALDSDVDVRDPAVATRAILDRLRIPEGLIFTEGVLDALDHSSPQPLWGGKLGVDATWAMAGEPGSGSSLGAGSPPPDPEELYGTLLQKFPNLQECRVPLGGTRLHLALLVLAKGRPGEGMDLAREALAVSTLDIAVAVEGRREDDLRRLAWRALSSIDPGRDIEVLGNRVAVDATSKGPAEGHHRPWPAELTHPPEVGEKAEVVAQALGLTDS